MSLSSRINNLATQLGQLMKLHLTSITSLENKTTVLAGTAFPVQLDRPRNYGYPAAMTGNITVTNATAILGPVVMIRLNQATEPTYPANFVKISGTFKPSVDNFYYVECVYVAGAAGANNVYHFTISQTP